MATTGQGGGIRRENEMGHRISPGVSSAIGALRSSRPEPFRVANSNLHRSMTQDVAGLTKSPAGVAPGLGLGRFCDPGHTVYEFNRLIKKTTEI
jgi:hypothetical protein